MKRDKSKQRRQLRRFVARMKGKRMAGVAALIIVSTLVLTPLAYARDHVSEAAKDFTKAGASIPQHIAETTNESNIINGVVVGTAKGILGTVHSIGKGIVELFTFYQSD